MANNTLAQASTVDSAADAPPIGAHSHINLVDRTVASDDESQPTPTLTQPPTLTQAPTSSSFAVPSISHVRSKASGQKAKWKYGRYTEERATGRKRSGTVDTIASVQDQESNNDAEAGESNWGQSKLERGRNRVQDKIRRKKQKKKRGETSEIDVLYENQRGTFLFGMPFFSAKALSHFEPSPWVDGEYNKSRVNITNAQVPDPSWEWAWKTWYVDMSRDVDEEGWQYSFHFKGFSWHGTHPWAHSFVRRRKWIRKRVRKPSALVDKTLGDAHLMNTDYFTIHSGHLKTSSSGLLSPSTAGRSYRTKTWAADEAESWISRPVEDVGNLIRALKEVPVDSERIVLIRRFLDEGGDEVQYLAEKMSTIMSYFLYDHSCRRLLALLTDKINDASDHRDEHEETGKRESANEKTYIDALIKAAGAVDEQCKKLEFWSDVRQLTRNGDTVHATNDDAGWGHEWSGLDKSGPENDRTPPKTDGNDDDSPLSDERASRYTQSVASDTPRGTAQSKAEEGDEYFPPDAEASGLKQHPAQQDGTGDVETSPEESDEDDDMQRLPPDAEMDSPSDFHTPMTTPAAR